MLDAEVTNHIFTTSLRCLPLIRYAEVLLNFAEARNEYSGPDQDVYDAIEAIRKRAGLDPYTLPPGLNTEEIDRKSVVKGKSVSVVVDVGGSRIVQKNKNIATML